MSNSKRTFASRRRLNTTLKVAALLAALGLVTVMIEQPRTTASPRHPTATLSQRASPAASGAASLNSRSEPAASLGTSEPLLEQRMYSTDSGDAPLNARSEPAVSLNASEPLFEQRIYSTDSGDAPLNSKADPVTSAYFPGRFAPPRGEVESQPPTF